MSRAGGSGGSPTNEHPPRPLPFGGDGAIMPAISRLVAGKRRRLVDVRRSAAQNLWPHIAHAARNRPVWLK